MDRGRFQFHVGDSGDLLADESNVEALRRTWLDRTLVTGEDLGPGDAGDFDVGAWHSACHLVAAGGVRRAADGRLLWLELSHDEAADLYGATVTFTEEGRTRTFPVAAPEAKAALAGSTLLGFVEGTSGGRISARSVLDSPSRFNLWCRQSFDQPVDSTADGGRVWEHWCTTRDISRSVKIADSVLRGYVALAASLGDRFPAAVIRGRRDYGHPKQLCALVKAGFVSRESALWETTPRAIPPPAARFLLEGTPAAAHAAAGLLSFDGAPVYHMFPRKIAAWSPAASVKADLAAFG